MSTTRRHALAIGAAVTTVTACASESDAPEESADSGASTSQKTTGNHLRLASSEVPEGGGVVKDRIVVTQPTAGEYKAFDVTCPHEGCAVNEITTSAIICPCHGSEFDPESGAVLKGPAGEALTSKKIVVNGDELIVSI